MVTLLHRGWTKVRKRLTKHASHRAVLTYTALTRFRASDDAKDVKFTVKYLPFQLYPESSKDGEDKYEWYKRSRYGDSDEKMKKMMALMGAYGKNVGIDFKFHGTVANTFDAHRLVQHYQEEKGADVADKLINCK